MGPRLTNSARDLLLRQRRVIATWQVSSVAMDSRAFKRALRTDPDWRPIGRRSILWSERAPTPEQLRVAARLEAGPVAALAGRAALAEAGWSERTAPPIDVLVPRGRRSAARSLPSWVRMHQTSGLDQLRVTAVESTTPARALIDAVAWTTTPRQASYVALSALQQRVTRTDDVRRELRRLVRPRFGAMLRELLTDFDHGVAAVSERDFRALCRRNGLPTPVLQVRRRVGDHTYVTDAEFTDVRGRRVIVEVDGVGHMTGDTWLKDLRRQNELVAAAGARVLRVTSWELRHDPEPFCRVLRTVLVG